MKLTLSIVINGLLIARNAELHSDSRILFGRNLERNAVDQAIYRADLVLFFYDLDLLGKLAEWEDCSQG